MTMKMTRRTASESVVKSSGGEETSVVLARRKSKSTTLELTKALRHEYEEVQDLIVNFRTFAKVTQVGSAEDAAQIESLRTEATVLAAMVKQTVPTVMWNWLCKVLADEHAENVAEEEKNRERSRRYFGR